MHNTIKLIVADDHEHIIASIQNLVAEERGIEILSTAGNGGELLRLARSLQPCMVVTDIDIAGTNGIDATLQLAQTHPQIKVVILSGCKEAAVICRAMAAGAKGYVLKTSPRDEITWAIKTVYECGEYLCPGTEQILKKHKPVAFTKREYEVIRNYYDGLSAAATADNMDLSPRTVQHYKERIMQKMNVNNFADFIKYVIVNKLLLINIIVNIFTDAAPDTTSCIFNYPGWLASLSW